MRPVGWQVPEIVSDNRWTWNGWQAVGTACSPLADSAAGTRVIRGQHWSDGRCARGSLVSSMGEAAGARTWSTGMSRDRGPGGAGGDVGGGGAVRGRRTDGCRSLHREVEGV